MGNLKERIENLSPEQREILLKRIQQKQEKNEPAGRTRITAANLGSHNLPLSFGQQRLWFLDKYEKGSATYNIPITLKLEGSLDIQALEKTLTLLIDRHAILRSAFSAQEGKPVLNIQDPAQFHLVVVDLTGAAETEREQLLLSELANESARPFQLEAGGLVRVALYKLTPTEYVLHFVIHHIIMDGWSFEIFNREMTQVYSALINGTDPNLPELPFHYQDFSAWQHEFMKGKLISNQINYWKNQLQGAPAFLDLPTDYPRPALRTYHGAVEQFLIPRNLIDPVRELSRKEGATLYMAMLAAFQVLLRRYTGQTDIVAGSPIAGRQDSNLENLIGLFINTLVFRTDLSGNPTFRELLVRVRETAVGAYANQDVPFEKLVEELKPRRELSHSPIFQVLFVYQNYPWQDLTFPEIKMTYLELESKTAKFDLSLYLREIESGIEVFVEFNTDLFRPETIRRMAGHYQILLHSVGSEPDCRVTAMPLLTQGEQNLILSEWNETGAQLDLETGVHELFAKQAERTPDAPAISDHLRKFSYAELNYRSNQLAHYLLELGVQPETLVGISTDRSIDMVVALLAIQKAGAAYVPLDPALPIERRSYMLSDANIHILLTQKRLVENLPADFMARSPQVVCLDTDSNRFDLYPTHNPAAIGSNDRLIYTMYTSGSTGRPKGVQVTHRAVRNFLDSMRRQPGMQSADKLLALTTLSFDIAGLEIYLPLCTGAQVHLVSREVASDGQQLQETLRTFRPTIMQATPATWRLLFESGWDGDPHMVVLCGGEALSAELAQRLSNSCKELWNLYGPTETTIWSTVEKILPGQMPITIGKPIRNTQVYIVDENLQPVPEGIAGELLIGGQGLARGYLNRPELTAEKFINNPFTPQESQRLYRTGDLARFREGGRIEYIGRSDFQVKIRGFRIELGEIETVLSQHSAVKAAAVIVREDDPGDKKLVAYVTIKPDQAVTPPVLREYLKTHLPDYMVPATFVVMDEFPLTHNGKLDRKALPVPETNLLNLGSGFQSPRNEIEQQIADVWAEILKIDRVGIDDNFFDLGGESFKVIRVVQKIGHGVGVMDIFTSPTVRNLAAKIARKNTAPTGLLHQLTPETAQPPKFTLVCIPFAGGSAAIFQPLAKKLPSGIALFALQPPGHDLSHPEEALEIFDTVAEKCVAEIRKNIQGPIVLLSHCLGGAMLVNIAYRLETQGLPLRHIFIGGHFPSPRLPGKFFETWHKLFPSDRWTARKNALEDLRALGFFTEQLDTHEQDFIVRNFIYDSSQTEDFYTEVYTQQSIPKLKAPITCVIGEMDRATELYEERYKEWLTFNPVVDLKVIPQAGHYFLKHQAAELAQIVVEKSTLNLPIEQVNQPSSEIPARIQTQRKAIVQPSLKVFGWVAFGQLISLIGTSLTAFASGLWVYQHTQSITAYSTILVFAVLPAILLAPIAGTIADRWDRRLIMIFSDILAACATLGLAILLWSNHLEFWHIYVFASIGAAANAFQMPAYQAAISQLVPKRYYGRANGIVQLGSSAGGFLAPFLAGFLVILIGLPGIVLIDFATFLIAVTITLNVRFPATLFKKQEEPFLKEVVNGWRYIIRRQGMVGIVILTALVNLLNAQVDALVAPLALSIGNETTLGLVLATSGAGLLLGSLLMTIWGGSRQRITAILVTIVLTGVFFITIGVNPSTTFFAMGMFGVGVTIAISNAHWFSIVQTKVGLELQGRVLATTLMLSWSTAPIGYLSVGPLTTLFSQWFPLSSDTTAYTFGSPGNIANHGIALVFILAGILCVLLAGLGYLYRPIRNLEKDLPDAIPDGIILADKDALQKVADKNIKQMI